MITHGGVVYTLEKDAGQPFERLPNLGSRWLVHHGDRVELGDRMLLVDEQDPLQPDGPAAEAEAEDRAVTRERFRQADDERV